LLYVFVNDTSVGQSIYELAKGICPHYLRFSVLSYFFFFISAQPIEDRPPAT
jgi:hypothetical protein